MQKMIVDGYNVIHADPELKRLIARNLQEARRGLIDRLSSYLKSRRLQLTVVFDGHGGMTDIDVEIPGRLQVLYSAAGQSADELILEILESSANPRSYIVVTSDMADIGRSAGGMGADVLPSTDFLTRLRSSRQNDSPSAGKKAGVDVDYWLEKFGQRDGEDEEG